MIYVSSFQPFSSRIGQDTVIQLQFQYDPDLIADLKKVLRNYKQEAFDPARHIFNAGGWRPEEKSWYVERSVWDKVKRDLTDLGYQFEAMEEVDLR